MFCYRRPHRLWRGSSKSDMQVWWEAWTSIIQARKVKQGHLRSRVLFVVYGDAFWGSLDSNKLVYGSHRSMGSSGMTALCPVWSQKEGLTLQPGSCSSPLALPHKILTYLPTVLSLLAFWGPPWGQLRSRMLVPFNSAEKSQQLTLICKGLWGWDWNYLGNVWRMNGKHLSGHLGARSPAFA